MPIDNYPCAPPPPRAVSTHVASGWANNPATVTEASSES